MVGYEVVPKALVDMTTVLADAVEVWRGLQKSVGEWSMEPLALGLLGSSVDYPAGYNGILGDVGDKLQEAVESFSATEQALSEVAGVYLAQEAAYYEEFGYTEKSTDK